MWPTALKTPGQVYKNFGRAKNLSWDKIFGKTSFLYKRYGLQWTNATCASADLHRKNEDAAHKCNRKACGEDLVVESTELHLLLEKLYLGASSDGRMIYTNINSCCINCLEMKCPYSIKDNVNSRANNNMEKLFMHRGNNNMLHLSEEHPYYTQVQAF